MQSGLGMMPDIGSVISSSLGQAPDFPLTFIFKVYRPVILWNKISLILHYDQTQVGISVSFFFSSPPPPLPSSPTRLCSTLLLFFYLLPTLWLVMQIYFHCGWY